MWMPASAIAAFSSRKMDCCLAINLRASASIRLNCSSGVSPSTAGVSRPKRRAIAAARAYPLTSLATELVVAVSKPSSLYSLPSRKAVL